MLTYIHLLSERNAASDSLVDISIRWYTSRKLDGHNCRFLIIWGTNNKKIKILQWSSIKLGVRVSRAQTTGRMLNWSITTTHIFN